MSVDPGPFTIADPQSWNRFSYVQNNPLKFVDPTGAILKLNGLYADEFLSEMEQKSGLHLKRDPKTGEVTPIDGTKRDDKVGSKTLADLITKIIGNKHVTTTINLGENVENVFVDSFDQRLIDMADYRMINNLDGDNHVWAAVNMAHILGEYYYGDKELKGATGDLMARIAHLNGGGPEELNVLSELRGTKEKSLCPPRDTAGGWLTKTTRFEYSTVTYDVVRKTIGNNFDAIESISKTTNQTETKSCPK